MAATGRKAVDLIDCPVCGVKVTGDLTFEVIVGEVLTRGKVSATLKETGLRISHDCTPRMVRNVG